MQSNKNYQNLLIYDEVLAVQNLRILRHSVGFSKYHEVITMVLD